MTLPPPAPVVRAGAGHPVAVVPLPAGARVVLDPAPLPVDPALLAAGAAHRDAVLARSPGTFDGALLALWSASEDGLVVRPSSYFAMLATCDALRAEAQHDPDGPLRRRALAAAGDPWTSGAGRAAAVGVSVACTVPVGGRAHLVLGRRRAGLAADPGAWHVAPSGMLEDGAPDPLAATVATELREELGVVLDAADVARRLVVLGLAHDVRRLRPDVCVRLDLRAGEVPPGGPHPHPSEYDDRDLVPLDALPALWARRPPGTLTAPAAGTLALLGA
ncbi:NUDIX domain-containing protein [Vallicoccus soli]|uniref:Nudix hydrolase domain-containing protein n=1 Tax=Vallicoccus soli TaxID=2339232 RepID=A0A3A3Z2V1_9ACTN|nr:NUDIX domain-containing protein [Vallicoccus soli]RJK97732.1 hypothetical protein D5H78_01650 [Vallicoccus soli]